MELEWHDYSDETGESGWYARDADQPTYDSAHPLSLAVSERSARIAALEDENAKLEAVVKRLETLRNNYAALEAENARLSAIVERFVGLSVSAEPRWEDKHGWFLTEPRRQSTWPTRKVYVVDAGDFDAASEAAAKGGE